MIFDKKVFSVIENILKITSVTVLEKMTKSTYEPLPTAIKSNSSRKYITTIGLYGTCILENSEERKIRGNVVLSWELETYIQICNAIFHEERKEYSDEIKDMGMEILNTIIGNSKPDLRSEGIFLEMALPNGFIGTQVPSDILEKVILNETSIESRFGNTQLLVTCSYAEREDV